MTQSNPEQAKALVDGLVEFSGGDYIFKEGERGLEMYIVEAGQVEILKRTDGRERRLSLLKRGDFFGEEAVLTQLSHTASAKAVTDCAVLPVDEAVLREMLEQGAQVGMLLLQGLAKRSREATRLASAVFSPMPTIKTRKISGDEPWPPEAEPKNGFGSLVHIPSGVEFPLPDSAKIKIGRRDVATGADPDVNLSSVDSRHSLSRAHAQLLRRGDQLLVADEAGSANGTYVNGQRVERGSPIEVKDGDELRFGLIKTRYRAAG